MGTKKLSLNEVQEIRRLLENGTKGKELALRYGVSNAHISHIKMGCVRNAKT
jgi:DNA-binding Xre family transcriptional regulator